MFPFDDVIMDLSLKAFPPFRHPFAKTVELQGISDPMTTMQHYCHDNRDVYVDGFMQKKRNPNALAMELRFFCMKPSMSYY